ncbi:VOC family protein [Fulvivirgaceae bacterium PWU5]|uniref:VOC family protein n=1 Tax=Dawidia cretensis TaxID=2782350 RepID=A0AAP2GTW6_9BACT|nr:VOC family protein [Dawidia cretensis]MBT1708748.1 VOC family protein [Dawidia cretensis]
MKPHDTPNFRIENIAPILKVQDVPRSIDFYTRVLGFRNADWGTDQFTLIHRDNTGIYLCQNGQGSSGTWVWIGFDGNIFTLHQTLQVNNVRIKLPPTNFSWAYEMQVEDPDGHILRLGTDPSDNEPFADQQVTF